MFISNLDRYRIGVAQRTREEVFKRGAKVCRWLAVVCGIYKLWSASEWRHRRSHQRATWSMKYRRIHPATIAAGISHQPNRSCAPGGGLSLVRNASDFQSPGTHHSPVRDGKRSLSAAATHRVTTLTYPKTYRTVA